jgi:hypothetical protein
MEQRHRTLADREESMVLLVDCQERLFPVITGSETLELRQQILLKGAVTLGIPVLVTEQYKKDLGATRTKLLEAAPKAPVLEKLTFSCFGDPPFMAKFQELERGTLIVAGIEAHICVLQTALDALAEGYQVHVVADAVGSRDEANKRLALKRLAKAGAVITCVESVLFEWMIRCDVSEFKDIQRLVK